MSIDPEWETLEVLAEPTRRRVYDVVRAAPAAVTREEAADAASINARLAAFHLDRLAEAGLLDVHYARPPGRSGPGAGRPAKRYAPATCELQVSVPPRRYNLVARILAAAVASSPKNAAVAAEEWAGEEGRCAGAPHRPVRRPSRATALAAVQQALSALGFEPRLEESKLRLRNCPFHDVVDVAPKLVCSLNHELVTGIIEGAGCEQQLAAFPDGVLPDCCVTVAAAAKR